MTAVTPSQPPKKCRKISKVWRCDGHHNFSFCYNYANFHFLFLCLGVVCNSLNLKLDALINFGEKPKYHDEKNIFVWILWRPSQFQVWRPSQPFWNWIFSWNQSLKPGGHSTIQPQIYSSFTNQLRIWKSVKKWAWYPTLHFFFKSGFSHFLGDFSTSSLSFYLACNTLDKIAKLPLQTISFGILISLLGAEK